MIKTLSPHYLLIPRVNPDSSVICISYTLKIYVWSGSKSAVPSTPDYEITRVNATSTDQDDKVNIARIVNDFIDFLCVQSVVTSLENGNNQYWVKTEVYYNDQPTLAQLQNITLSVRGYGYFMEGENPQIPNNKILLEGDEFKVSRNGYFVLPIMMDEPEPVVPFLIIESITLDEGDDYTLVFTTNIAYDAVSYRFRLEPETDWTLGGDEITASPFTIVIPTVSGTYNVQIFAFDPLTSEVVISASYDLIIP